MTSPPESPRESPRNSVHVFPDIEALSRAAAQHIVSHMDRVLSEADRYTLALAGGSTPRRLYELLTGVYSGDLPWKQVHVFWGDERFVPHDDPNSNVRLARETLLDHVDIPEGNVHPIPTETEPTAEAAARAYAATLQRAFDSPASTFDAALLGVGSDGHTASLFPPLDRTDAPSDPSAPEAWAKASQAPPEASPRTRVTCTLPVLNGARQALVLASGSRKQEALHRVLADPDPSLPAAQIQPRSQLSWFLDAAAQPPGLSAS